MSSRGWGEDAAGHEPVSDAKGRAIKAGDAFGDRRQDFPRDRVGPRAEFGECDFAGTLATDQDGRVAGLLVPGGGEKLSRKEIDDYQEFVKIYGAKGLAYIKFN